MANKKVARNVLIVALALCIALLSYLTLTRYFTAIPTSRIMYFTKTLSVDESTHKSLLELENHCKTSKPRTSFIRNKLWFVMNGGREEISVYGAYGDDRDSIPSIRIFAVSNSPAGTAVYCHLWFTGHDRAVIQQADVQTIGRGADRLGSHYDERLYKCSLPGRVFPEYVSLTFQRCSNATALVPVKLPPRKQEVDIGVCVGIAYGHVDAEKLVEWIEINSLLGVGEINIYASRLNLEAMQVLEHYNKSVVKLQRIAPPVRDWCTWCQKLSTLAVINDCMYSNMYRYKYMIVIDFDEVIVPYNYDNLMQAIDTVIQSNSAPAIVVRNAYFFTDFTPKRNTSLFTIKHQTRLKPNDPSYAPKSILRPSKCVVMQNHYCAIRTDDVGALWTVVAAEEELLLHHYKPCHFGYHQCEEVMKESVEDGVMARFQTDLERRISATFQKLDWK